MIVSPGARGRVLAEVRCDGKVVVMVETVKQNGRSERCPCLACKGKTVKFSRARFVKSMDFYVEKNLVTRAYADESIRDFDDYHSKPKAERDADAA